MSRTEFNAKSWRPFLKKRQKEKQSAAKKKPSFNNGFRPQTGALRSPREGRQPAERLRLLASPPIFIRARSPTNSCASV